MLQLILVHEQLIGPQHDVIGLVVVREHFASKQSRLNNQHGQLLAGLFCGLEGVVGELLHSSIDLKDFDLDLPLLLITEETNRELVQGVDERVVVLLESLQDDDTYLEDLHEFVVGEVVVVHFSVVYFVFQVVVGIGNEHVDEVLNFGPGFLVLDFHLGVEFVELQQVLAADVSSLLVSLEAEFEVSLRSELLLDFREYYAIVGDVELHEFESDVFALLVFFVLRDHVFFSN